MSTVCGAELDNCITDFFTASLERAIVDSKSEVLVLAEAGSIGSFAAELLVG